MPEPAATPKATEVPAPFSRRAGAAAIDLLILAGVLFATLIVAAVVYIVATGTDEPDQIDSGDAEILSLICYGITFVAFGVYSVALESSSRRATLGKRALGLTVSGPSGERLSVLRASLRYLARLAIPFTLLIAFLMIAWTPKRQSLYDLMTDATVTYREPPGG